MTIEDYDPKSSLKVPEHPKTRAKFPIIDFHNHQRGEMPAAQMDKLVADMDAINLQIMVNLSGGYGDRLKRNVTAMKAKYKDRFAVFANLSFEEIDAPDYSDRAARQQQVMRLELQGAADLAARVQPRHQLADAIDQDVLVMDRRPPADRWCHHDLDTVAPVGADLAIRTFFYEIHESRSALGADGE